MKIVLEEVEASLQLIQPTLIFKIPLSIKPVLYTMQSKIIFKLFGYYIATNDTRSYSL